MCRMHVGSQGAPEKMPQHQAVPCTAVASCLGEGWRWFCACRTCQVVAADKRFFKQIRLAGGQVWLQKGANSRVCTHGSNKAT